MRRVLFAAVGAALSREHADSATDGTSVSTSDRLSLRGAVRPAVLIDGSTRDDGGASPSDRLALSGSAGSSSGGAAVEEAPHAVIPGVTAAAAAYDYFLLEQQYAITLCTDGTYKCTASNQWMTLHGLWAERTDGSYPDTCGGAAYDPSLNKDLLPQLNKYWPSLNGGYCECACEGATLQCTSEAWRLTNPLDSCCAAERQLLCSTPPTTHAILPPSPTPSPPGPNDKFWNHEWVAHGTCATDVFPRGQHDFFGEEEGYLPPRW